MTPVAVTARLLHHLITGSHAEAITTLDVEAAITAHTAARSC